jgi:beta-N-acetylhexosaminidase
VGDPADQAASIAAKLSDEDLVGQVLMPFAYGTHATKVAGPAAAANRNAYGVATPAELIRRYRLGGLILVRQAGDPTGGTNPTTNVESPDQVRRLTGGLQQAAGSLPAARAAGGRLPLLVGTDQEHGVVTRIREGMTLLPTAMAFGAAADPGLTERAWRMAGTELAAVGVNVDFAPDADVIRDTGNLVIGSRSYGSEPKRVSKQVSAAVRGLQGAGVAATLKHFPGHGHTSTDSHQALPVLGYDRNRLDRVDLPPFRAGIAAGAELVMSGHLDTRAIAPGTPASFSRKVLVDLLRDKLGFRGVVVSDGMGMAPARAWPPGEAAVRAILAGNDLLLLPPNLPAAQRGLLQAMDSGKLPRNRMVQAVTRILTLKLRLAAHRQPALSTVDSPEHRAVAEAVAAAAVTVFRGRCSGRLVSEMVRVTGGTPEQRTWLSEALRERGVAVGATGTQVHLTGYGDGPADLAPGAAVTVGMDVPYLLSRVRSASVLAVFGANRYAMRAVAAVLAGATMPSGRSPVPVQGLPRTACAG